MKRISYVVILQQLNALYKLEKLTICSKQMRYCFIRNNQGGMYFKLTTTQAHARTWLC